MDAETCYMCDSVATTREHAPARCMFPEAKDIDGRDLRRNLISVPSCDAHNSAFSKDDEYFLAIVTSQLQGNDVSRRQFDTKVLRAVRRKPAIVDAEFRSAVSATVDGQDVMVLRADSSRVRRAMDKTTRALVYHCSGEKLLSPLTIYLPGFREPDGQHRSSLQRIDAQVQELLVGCDVRGENPEVFAFQLHLNRDRDVSILRMSLFEAFPVIAAWGAGWKANGTG